LRAEQRLRVFENMVLRSGENYIVRSCMSVLLTKYYSGGHIDHIEKNEMGGACRTYVKRGGVYRVFLGGGT
jgi:hypothetical protein